MLPTEIYALLTNCLTYHNGRWVPECPGASTAFSWPPDGLLHGGNMQNATKYLDDMSSPQHAICSKNTHAKPDSNSTTADWSPMLDNHMLL